METTPPDINWTYTIGLTAGFDHPELVIAAVEFETAGAVLNELGDRIRDGKRFDVAGSLVIDDVELGLGPVHPVHIQHGLLDAWIDYYSAFGTGDVEPRAMQVILPDDFFCPCHACAQPILASPDARLLGRGPNRATRRQAERRRRRRPR